MVDVVAVRALPTSSPEHSPCRQIGQFVAKGGCFALHGSDGVDVWLEIDPVPLHMLDENVEVAGLRYGHDLIWVQSIGPVRSFS